MGQRKSRDHYTCHTKCGGAYLSNRFHHYPVEGLGFGLDVADEESKTAGASYMHTHGPSCNPRLAGARNPPPSIGMEALVGESSVDWECTGGGTIDCWPGRRRPQVVGHGHYSLLLQFVVIILINLQ